MSKYTLNIVVVGKDDASSIFADVGKATERLGKQLDESGKKADGASQIMTGALRRVGELATNALAEAGQAVVGFVADSIKQAGDFEAGMNRFASVTGDSVTEAGFSLDDFKEKFLQLGAETQFSAAQAQDAAIELAKGGVAVSDIMGDAAQATLDLAAAGELELAPAAGIVAKQLGVWKSEGVTATEVSNALAQAANASTVDVDELALGLANAGGVAKVTGVSFRDTVQTMALLAPGFSSAADAGTSYKTFLSRLIPTTDNQAEAMARLNLLTEDGKSKFYDASGSFIGMRQAAVLLHESTKNLSQEQRQLAFNTIFGSDAIRAAAMIAEQGGEGFDAMGVAMAGAGTAAEQAAKRSKGFNFALDSLMGSVETLGIVAGSALLPVLTSLINDGLIPIVNAATGAAKHLDQLGSFLGAVVVPALYGATAATIAYALANSFQLVTAMSAAIAKVAAFTTTLAANTVATLAATGPLIAIGAAVAGVAWAWQNFDGKVKSATQALLEGKQWWNESTAALEQYDSASKEVQGRVSAHAATIRELRSEIQSEVEDLGRRSAAGLVSEAQYNAEMDAIRAKKDGLIVVTGAMESEIQAMARQQAAATTATNALAVATAGTEQLAVQSSMTAEEIEKLGKEIEKTYQKGAEAVQSYVDTEVSFLAQATEAREKHDSESLKSLAARYAQEQAAQKAHLGQMLIDYTLAQVQMGNIATEKAGLITQAIEKEFGVQKDASATTFLEMAAHIDKFAASGSSDLNALSSTLGSTADTAVATKQKMDELAKKYEAQLIHNFEEGKISAQELADKLKEIPSKVYSEVITTHRDVYETGGVSDSSPSGGTGKRAAGGPVSAGKRYLVGEEGPELFVPGTSGTIVPTPTLEAMLGGQAVAPQTINQTYITIAPGAIVVQAAPGQNVEQLADLVLNRISNRLSLRR